MVGVGVRSSRVQSLETTGTQLMEANQEEEKEVEKGRRLRLMCWLKEAENHHLHQWRQRHLHQWRQRHGHDAPGCAIGSQGSTVLKWRMMELM